MVLVMGLPLKFWGEAAEYAAYILNRIPTKANSAGVSLIDLFTKKKPIWAIRGLWFALYGSPAYGQQVFGCAKESAIIIGKNDEIKGYRIYLKNDCAVLVTARQKHRVPNRHTT